MSKKHFVPRLSIADAKAKSPRELAQMYGVSLSTVYRWKRVVKDGDHLRLQRDLKIDGRILGILWALGRDDGTYFLIRYKERSLLEEICKYSGLSKQIITGRSQTNIQYRLKLTNDIRKNILYALIKRHGWSPRNADIRQYPIGDIDHMEFILAYVQIHSTLEFPKGRSRLRIYGNKLMMEEMNDIIPRVFSVARKTPQRIADKTYALCYQRESEISELLPGFEPDDGEIFYVENDRISGTLDN